MKTQTIEFGDRVRHPKFPEWGSGAVIKVEQTPINGEPTTRVTVRFSSAGLKSFVGNQLPLELLSTDHEMPGDKIGTRPAISDVEDLERSGLTQAVEQKLLEIMHVIPMACRDPFNTAEHRLRRTFELFKYDMSGRGLMEWAMAQTGMDDPLTRFSRTELEEFFKEYSHELNRHLAKLLSEMHEEKATVDRLLSEAPMRAKRAVQRIS